VIVAACIAPHGTPAFDPGPTRDALEEVARRFEQAQPEAIVVVTPHNVHVEGHFAVVTAARAEGSLAQWEHPEIALEREVDRQLAAAILAELEPAVGISYGGNDPAEAVMPLDWGALIPLAFLPELPVVVVSPARDLGLEAHVRAGEAIARAPGRIGLVASADHGHAHDPEGPYGFDPAAADYDERVVELVRENRWRVCWSSRTSRVAARRTASGRWSSCTARSATAGARSCCRTRRRPTSGCWLPPSPRGEAAARSASSRRRGPRQASAA
jgi:aromatic ring-opening dioxygenase LigB subunit